MVRVSRASQLAVFMLLAVLAGFSYAGAPPSCKTLASSYTLTTDVSSSSTCFNITAPNVLLDCTGHMLSGANVTGTYGVYSDQLNTTVTNCQIRDFDVGIYLAGSYGTAANNAINSMMDSGRGIVAANEVAPGNGQIIAWTFADNVSSVTSGAVLDYSGNGNNATLGAGVLANAPAWVSDPVFGGAYSFDGAASFIDFQDTASQHLYDNATFSLWIKPHGDWGGNYATILDKGDSPMFRIQRAGPTHSIQFFEGRSPVPGGQLNTEQWNHVVISISGGTALGYLNGQAIFNDSVVNPLPQSFTYGTIGTYNPRNAVFFNGQLSRIYIYNRSMNCQEMSQLYYTALTNITITGNNITAKAGAVGLLGVENSTITRNNFTSNLWVSDFTALGPHDIDPFNAGASDENVNFNDSTAGNAYYFSNGSLASGTYNLTSSIGSGYADGGSGRPLSSNETGAWYGVGRDYKPFTNRSGPNIGIDELYVYPSEPVFDDIQCAIRFHGPQTANVAIEWYLNGTNQSSLAQVVAVQPDVLTATADVSPGLLHPNDKWGCKANVQFNSTNSSGWETSANKTIGMCGTLYAANRYHLLSTDITHAGTCMTVWGNNITIDCGGHSITGDNSTGSVGIQADDYGTVVANCKVSNFSIGVYYLDSTAGKIANSNISTTYIPGGYWDNNGMGLYVAGGKQITLSNTTIFSNSGEGFKLQLTRESTFNNFTANSNANGYYDYLEGIFASQGRYNTISNFSTSSIYVEWNTAYHSFLKGTITGESAYDAALRIAPEDFENVFDSLSIINNATVDPASAYSVNGIWASDGIFRNRFNNITVASPNGFGFVGFYDNDTLTNINVTAYGEAFDFSQTTGLPSTVINITARNTGNDSLTDAAGFFDVHDTVIQNVVAVSNQTNGISVVRSDNLTIINANASTVFPANGMKFLGSSNNTVKDSYIASNGSYSLLLTYYLGADSSNNTFINNTFVSQIRNSTLAYLELNSSGNVFYWNNFTNTSGYYVQDLNGSNYYNTSLSGQPAGNIWFSVMNGSVKMNGTVQSPFSGLYYASSGTGYPYNNTTSKQGTLYKLSGNVTDYAPLVYMPPANVTLSSPANGYSTSNANPTFAWSAVSVGGVNLNCALSIQGGAGISGITVANGTMYSTMPSFPLSLGTHTWYVACGSAGNAIGSSDIWSITITQVSTPSQPNNNGGGSITVPYAPPSPQPPEQNVTNPASQPQPTNTTPSVPPTADKAGAEAAVAQAEAALNNAVKDGKDISQSVWSISAAKDALVNGDYAEAERLAALAVSQIGQNAASAPGGQPTSQPSAPQAIGGNTSTAAGGSLFIIGAGVAIVILAVGAYLFLRGKKN